VLVNAVDNLDIKRCRVTAPFQLGLLLLDRQLQHLLLPSAILHLAVDAVALADRLLFVTTLVLASTFPRQVAPMVNSIAQTFSFSRSMRFAWPSITSSTPFTISWNSSSPASPTHTTLSAFSCHSLRSASHGYLLVANWLLSCSSSCVCVMLSSTRTWQSSSKQMLGSWLSPRLMLHRCRWLDLASLRGVVQLTISVVALNYLQLHRFYGARV